MGPAGSCSAWLAWVLTSRAFCTPPASALYCALLSALIVWSAHSGQVPSSAQVTERCLSRPLVQPPVASGRLNVARHGACVVLSIRVNVYRWRSGTNKDLFARVA